MLFLTKAFTIAHTQPAPEVIVKSSMISLSNPARLVYLLLNALYNREQRTRTPPKSNPLVSHTKMAFHNFGRRHPSRAA